MAFSNASKNVALDAIGAAATWLSVHSADPGTTGATDLRLEFLCNDFTEKRLDLVATATYATKKPMSLKAINAWNQEYRWSRAYLDEKNQAVLQMDMNAEGGLGKDNLQILLNTFISIAEDFGDAAKAPAK